MGRGLYDSSSVYRDTFDAGCAVLQKWEDLDLKTIVFDGPQDILTLTYHAQPALLLSNFSYLNHLIAEGVGPAEGDWMAGHSLGEWTAYVASGALSLEQGVRLVYRRGKRMSEAFPFEAGQRPMTAILGLSDEVVESVCRKTSTLDRPVVAANYNCPGQVVISGHPEAVSRASEELRKLGGKPNNEFPVGGPFHSPLLAGARGLFARDIVEIAPEFGVPRFGILSNYTGREIARDGDHVASLLDQLTGAVQWTASMVRAWELGVVQMVPIDVAKNTLQAFAQRIFSAERPVQTVDPKIAMYRNALRYPAGVIDLARFPEPAEVLARRLLTSSYNAAAVAQEVRRLIATREIEDLRTALLVLENSYLKARDAGLRELYAIREQEAVREAMQRSGLEWPSPEVRDLPTTALPNEVEIEIEKKQKRQVVLAQWLEKTILSELQQLGLAPINPNDLSYYFATRWNGESQKLEAMLVSLLRLVKWGAEGKLGLKQVSDWDSFVRYIDESKGVEFPHPGVFSQGDIE